MGVYVHWPFCVSKCPYCDFNSHVRERIDEARWRAALVRELARAREETGARQVASVFFGGGTPSLMEPATVGAVLETIARLWDAAPDAEVTLEANPGSVEQGRFRGYRAAGVNRVSIGAQALDDAALAFLGRKHVKAEGEAAIRLAGAIFPRVSFDLIYARPGQTPAAWRAELARALAFGTEHLSLYQLTLEPGTRFQTLADRGELALPPDDEQAALMDVTEELTGAAGLPAYEVSNHARSGAACRHNLIYWRTEDWVGVGPGAHGRFGQGPARRAVVRRKLPEAWLAAVEKDGHGTESDAPATTDETVGEALMMGLRLAEGIDAARFTTATGMTIADAVPEARLAPMVAGGFLVGDAAGLRATPAGMRVLNGVVRRLLG